MIEIGMMCRTYGLHQIYQDYDRPESAIRIKRNTICLILGLAVSSNYGCWALVLTNIKVGYVRPWFLQEIRA